MTQKHTQGPWELSEAISPQGAPVIYSPSVERVVCALHYERVAGSGEYGVFDNLEANAALIAAAPDMYEALKMVWSDEFGLQLANIETIDAVEKAIAKAEGR